MAAFVCLQLLLTPMDPLDIELARFPGRAHVCDCLHFNRQHYHYLLNRQGIEPILYWQYQEAINETNRLFDIYDTLDSAQRCGSLPFERECLDAQGGWIHLKHLRELLGEDAYQRGQLPLCVPLQHFQYTED